MDPSSLDGPPEGGLQDGFFDAGQTLLLSVKIDTI